MDERQALVVTIIMHPEDDLPRLVLADWYDEHDEPDRARFIRLQCEVSRHAREPDIWKPLANQADQIWKAHLKDWAGPLAAVVERGELHCYRGQIQLLSFDESQFLTPEVQAALIEVLPTIGLQILSLSPGIDQDALRASYEAQRRTRTFHPRVFYHPNSIMDQVARSPALAWVSTLLLADASTSDAGLAALAESPHLARLNKLALSYPQCTDAGLESLAGSELLTNFRWLDLSNCGGIGPTRFSDRGIRAVLASTRLPRFDKLSVTGEAVPSFEVGRLLADPAVARLRGLTLDAADAFTAVSRTQLLSKLETFWVSGPRVVVTEEAVGDLLENPALAGLQWLTLFKLQRENVRVSEAAMARLRERFGTQLQTNYLYAD